MIPAWFFRKIREDFEQGFMGLVQLRYFGKRYALHVHMTIDYTKKGRTRVQFGARWNWFCLVHGIEVGDRVIIRRLECGTFEINVLKNSNVTVLFDMGGDSPIALGEHWSFLLA